MNFIPTDDGRWVSEHYARLAEVVKDYDPQFELRWIPPENRTSDDDKHKPYVVWDTTVNQPFFFASELDTPEDILARLFNGDNKHGNVLERMEARNKAREILQLKEELDAREEREDYIAWLIGTKKNYITLESGQKVDDQLRPIL